VSKPVNGELATPANGGTIGFACNSPQQADARAVLIREFGAISAFEALKISWNPLIKAGG
jgi:hypothetical protein